MQRAILREMRKGRHHVPDVTKMIAGKPAETFDPEAAARYVDAVIRKMYSPTDDAIELQEGEKALALVDRGAVTINPRAVFVLRSNVELLMAHARGRA